MPRKNKSWILKEFDKPWPPRKKAKSDGAHIRGGAHVSLRAEDDIELPAGGQKITCRGGSLHVNN